MSFEWTSAPGLMLRAGGHNLEYACYGPAPKDAPTIVLLHEGLGCIALWRDLPQRLADETGYGVLVYSRAGYGGSDPAPLPRPLDYMTREATVTLADVINAAGLDNVVLMGHSDGATIAAIYAGSVSDLRVRGLVLIAPHFFTEEGGLQAIREAGRAFEEGDLRARLERYHSHVDVAFRGWYDAWTAPGFKDWNVADCIDHLRIPVLAVQGNADPYGTLAQVEEIATRIYSPLETAILEGCGHAPHTEAPDALMAAVVEFTARLRRIEQVEVVLG